MGGHEVAAEPPAWGQPTRLGIPSEVNPVAPGGRGVDGDSSGITEGPRSREGRTAERPEATLRVKLRYDPKYLSRRVKEKISVGPFPVGSALLLKIPFAEGSTLPEQIEVQIVPGAQGGQTPALARLVMESFQNPSLQAKSALLLGCPYLVAPCEESFSVVFRLKPGVAEEVVVPWTLQAVLAGYQEPRAWASEKAKKALSFTIEEGSPAPL